MLTSPKGYEGALCRYGIALAVFVMGIWLRANRGLRSIRLLISSATSSVIQSAKLLVTMSG